MLLVQSHAAIREGLRSSLEISAGFEVVGEASTGRQAVELDTLRPSRGHG